ncbi:MAG: flagellar basal-body MS-ring/collar protein FliF [Candidatus Margulisbacteria bacterium]|nr:flagellar basal-body MS-ring/collar protein FliF [Candidatus Margulisiibacteriota bacterium]
MVDVNEKEIDETSVEEDGSYEGVTTSKTGFLYNRWVQIGIAVFVVLLFILIGIGFFVRYSSTKNIKQEDGKKSIVNKSYKFVKVFESITPMDAAQIRKVLSYENIPFESVRDGRVLNVLVPKEYADQVKLKMAELGLPEGGIVGFEIFDEAAGLGATDYDRRIKYIRAISGELSRIISTMENINSARVQIVMPEKTLFGEKVAGSTSVILNIRDGAIVTDEQVKGIMHLVASSVENLTPENVAVIDNKGEILSDKLKKNIISKQFDDFIKMLRVSASDEESPLELLLKFKKELKDNYEITYTSKVKDVLKKLYPEGSFMVYTTVILTESAKESSPFEIGKINIAIILDNTNVSLNFNQEVKASTFQLVASVVDYVSGRDSIVIELMPFVNIEATKDIDINKGKEEFINRLEGSYGSGGKKQKNNTWIFLIFGFLALSSAVVIFVVYALSNKETEEVNDSDELDDNSIVELESREEDIDFSLEKFRSFVNNNEEMVIKKITKWMRNDDV